MVRKEISVDLVATLSCGPLSPKASLVEGLSLKISIQGNSGRTLSIWKRVLRTMVTELIKSCPFEVLLQ